MKITADQNVVILDGITYRRQKNGRFLGGYPQRKLHRVLYEKHFGAIPEGLVIHHKNGDHDDNRPENLEAITPREHNARHSERDQKHLEKAIQSVRIRCQKPEVKKAFGERIVGMWKKRAPREIRCIVCGTSKATICMKPVLYCGSRCKHRAKRIKTNE